MDVLSAKEEGQDDMLSQVALKKEFQASLFRLDTSITLCYIKNVNMMSYIWEEKIWYSKYPMPNLKL